MTVTPAALSVTNPTLLDVMKRTDPNGAPAKVVEVLSAKSAILQDATWVEGNLPTGHRFTTRTGLPTVAWRKFNEGVAASKSRTAQIDEACGMLAGRSQVDVEMVNLNGGGAAFRASEDMAFTASLKDELETSLIYASTASAPEEINGLAPRLNVTTDPGGSQIVICDSDASGSTDQTSMWLLAWSPETVACIYPKGSTGGLKATDMGEQLVDDGSSAGKSFRAYVTMWDWKVGLMVKDWRYLVRICDIDGTKIAAGTSPLIDAMVTAYHQLHDTNTGRLAFYCNRAVATYLHLLAKNDVKNSTLSIDNVGGKPITSFLGIPIRVTDAITSAEDVIV